MKIFLLILLGLIVWLVSAILSSLIVRKFFLYSGEENFWAVVCTLFAPATLIVIFAFLPFYFLYNTVRYILEK